MTNNKNDNLNNKNNKKENSRSDIVVKENIFSMSKRSQITVFIIIAVVLVIGIGAYFLARNNVFGQTLPKEMEPVYDYYLSCIQDETQTGAMILGQTAGYIEKPDFSPGSDFMPFSSQLNLLGNGIPYWYYVSGNGLVKEQVSSKDNMQEQLNDFLKKRISDCDFSQFKAQGFDVKLGEVNTVASSILDNKIVLKINQEIVISFENSTWKGTSHSREVQSNLGKLYDIARKIYEKQKKDMFLENYGIDVLRLYAPVDGTEITCSPKIWVTNAVRSDLINALEANTAAVKVSGNYYTLNKEEHKYFVQDIGEQVDANVNFMYSRFWPMKMEINPSEGGLIRADPVGLEEGMGVLGFCYVPYHFVYDLAYPVLIQVYYEHEMFQIPVVVVIDKNKPRQSSSDGKAYANAVPELCQNKNTKINVYSYNSILEPIDANIKFKCFDTSCDIGRTRFDNNTGESVLSANFPQCVNGYLIASANGYKTKKIIVSTVNQNSFNIALDKIYKLNLEIKGIDSSGYAIATFIKNNTDGISDTVTVAYPGQREVELSEGQYEIKVYIYSDAKISLAGGSSQKCVSVPKSGVSGMFGASEEKCFDLKIPDQVISFGVSGGGKQNYYISQSEIESSKKIIITPEKFSVPTKAEDLQLNYNKLETSHLDIIFE